MLRNIYSYIVRNPLYFYMMKRAHYGRYSSDEGCVDMALLKKVQEDGVAVVEKFLTKDECQHMLGEVMPELELLVSDEYEGSNKKHRYPEFGVYRLLELDESIPETKKFFADEAISSIAKAYVGDNVDSYQKMAEIRIGNSTRSSADACHFDDWRHRFKAFLYLTDVSSKNAPFRYLVGSHDPERWKFRRFWEEYEYYLRGRDGRFGHFTDEEKEKLISRYGFEELVCTAAAGTLILVDTKGLHSGTSLVEGNRVMLVNYFDVR